MKSSSKYVLFTDKSIQGFKLLVILNSQSIKINRFTYNFVGVLIFPHF